MKLTWVRQYKFCRLEFTAEAEDVETLIEIFDRVQTGKSNIGSKPNVPDPQGPIVGPDTPKPKAPTYSNKERFI